MDKKNLISQAAQPVNKLTIQYLAIDLIELSEEILSEVRGGWKNLDNLAVLQPLGGIRYIIWNTSHPSIPKSPPPVRIPDAI
jgi:hypothetical protein